MKKRFEFYIDAMDARGNVLYEIRYIAVAPDEQHATERFARRLRALNSGAYSGQRGESRHADFRDADRFVARRRAA